MDDLENSSSDQSDEELSSKLPVIVLDQHHRAYNMIRRYIDKKLLPENGNTIIHLDAHIDELVPKDIQIRAQLEAKLTESKLFNDIGTENWLKTAVKDNCIKHVIWVKPPWAVQVENGHVDLENNCTLDIKSLGKSVFEDSEEDYEGFKSLFSKYLEPGDRYILDMEYNFLSSDNPFTSDYPNAKDYYSNLKQVFELKIPSSKTKEDITNAAEERNKQLVELRKIFDYLHQNQQLPSEENYSPEIFRKVSNFREHLLKFYPEEKIDWLKIYSGGVVSNEYQLPVHHTCKEDIKKMLECFGRMLDVLPSPPTLITIAMMYEYDRYTPADTYEYITEALDDFFRNRYDNVEFEYEDF